MAAFTPFRWDDPFLLDAQLTDDERMIRDTAEQYAQEKLLPRVLSATREERFDREIMSELGELGLLGATIDGYGCAGVSHVAYGLIARAVERVDSGYRSAMSVQSSLVMHPIHAYGSEAQRETYLPRLGSGEIVGCFGLTEPDAGSDAASLRTVAVRDGDTYRITGTKRYITNAGRATVFTLMARSESEVKGSGGISAFIVPADTPGISLGKPDKKMGQRGAHVYDVILDDVVVPAANIIGGVPGRGFKTAMKVLDRGRIHIAAVAMGMCDRLIEMSLRYAMERKQFGQRIADFQLVQAMLADCKTEALAVEALMERAAARFDAGEQISLEASALKYLASETVGRIADRAVQIHGGAGYIAEYKVERFYRDVRVLRLYEGTSQIQQLIIAREMIRAAG